MKGSFFITVLFIAASVSAALIPARKTTIKNSKGFVVMELFTSQGCSSCPKADDLLGRYALQNDAHIFPVAFHVDYWNQLGWRDSLSNHLYTDRQEYYDEHYLHASVYTPQLVINGQTQMVGSDENDIKKAVDAALNETPSSSIDIKNALVNNNHVTVQYEISGTISNTLVNAMLVQQKVITKIKAGENNGATLTNYNVVRNLTSSPAKKSGDCLLHLPVGISQHELSIVLFIQDNISGKIMAAAKKEL
jgi:hypothetical protein